MVEIIEAQVINFVFAHQFVLIYYLILSMLIGKIIKKIVSVSHPLMEDR